MTRSKNPVALKIGEDIHHALEQAIDVAESNAASAEILNEAHRMVMASYAAFIASIATSRASYEQGFTIVEKLTLSHLREFKDRALAIRMELLAKDRAGEVH